MKAMPTRIKLGRAAVATLCMGLTTLLATQQIPLAKAQDPPPVQKGVNPTCVAAVYPCGDSCADGAATECRPGLNGWTWGACGVPNNKVKPCTNNGNTTDCGAEYDCSGNGGILGPCGGAYDTCTQA